jgi:hypothetical protein
MRNPNFAKIGQKYRALYIKSQVGFIFSGDLKPVQKRSFRVISYRAARIAEQV